MTNETEKKFFDAFGIECNILKHQQFNYAQVPHGLEFFKTREELVNAGMIKIRYKKLTPTPENNCIYWGEYHYPTITDRILLELIEIIIKFDFGIRIDYDTDGYGIASENYSGHFEENLKDSVLDYLITNKTLFYYQVRALFWEKEEKQ